MATPGRLNSAGPGRLTVKSTLGIPGRWGGITSGAGAATDLSITITSSGKFTTPFGLTGTIRVQGWGSGAAGGNSKTGASVAAGGGGGGAYAELSAFAATPNTPYACTVVAGGLPSGIAGNNGGIPGSDTRFGVTLMIAKRGTASDGTTGNGSNSGGQAAGSLGGDAAACVGDVKFSGGNAGKTATTTGGGGGGSSGGTGAGGGNGGDGGATGGAGGTAPTAGATGGAGGSSDQNGVAGTAPGGGGGGGCGVTVNKTGGTGGAGQIIISYRSTTGPGNFA